MLKIPHAISPCTCENLWDTVFKVDETGDIIETELFIGAVVGYLDHVQVALVQLLVNICKSQENEETIN